MMDQKMTDKKQLPDRDALLAELETLCLWERERRKKERADRARRAAA